MADRAWAVTELSRRLAAQLAEAGMNAEDEAGHLKEPLDDTLRMMGYAEGELETAAPEGADTLGFLHLARYNTLKAVRDRMADRFDLNTRGTGLRLQQQVATVERMIKEAEAAVIQVFGTIPIGAAAEDLVGYLELGTNTTPARVVGRDFPYTVIGVGDG